MFDIGHCRIKVKVTVGFSPFTAKQTVTSNNSTLLPARKIIARKIIYMPYVHLIILYRICKYHQARMISQIPRECLILIV